MGPEARTTLRRALQDGGELYLPEKMVLDLPEGGGHMYLPPSLLTPTASQRQGDITVERGEDWIKVSLPEDLEEESEDEDEDEDEDAGMTSDSSDEDEEDKVSGARREEGRQEGEEDKQVLVGRAEGEDQGILIWQQAEHQEGGLEHLPGRISR